MILQKKYFPMFAFSLASLVYFLNNTFLKLATVGTSYEIFFEEYLNDLFAPFVIFSIIEFIVKDKDRKYFLVLLVFIFSSYYKVFFGKSYDLFSLLKVTHYGWMS